MTVKQLCFIKQIIDFNTACLKNLSMTKKYRLLHNNKKQTKAIYLVDSVKPFV